LAEQVTLEPLSGTPANTTNWFQDLNTATPDVTPHIGYLHEAGIDFGWGPTSLVQWTMEHVHVFGGFAWWQTILVSAVIFRVLMLYPTVLSSDTMARMSHVRPQLERITEEYKRLSQSGRTAEAIAYRQTETAALKEFAGVSTTGLWLPLVIQAPLGFGTFRFLRNLSETPNLDMEYSGVLWFTDLTVADPYYVLPLAMSLWMHLFARVSIRWHCI
jgi:YidC/Oxa1 family membrane protein insertase